MPSAWYQLIFSFGLFLVNELILGTTLKIRLSKSTQAGKQFVSGISGVAYKQFFGVMVGIVYIQFVVGM